ncbi:hybrid sensor histidine kinase/response regulator [Magnetococcus sp. PR-3]|uniref:hybrid sensor histidine kinase/response regulator n=1 Tax=Magnetococcus sp. PR-3 TaxID=3120355 RepID=UPI002FCDEE2C
MTSIRAKFLIQSGISVLVVAFLGAASAVWVTFAEHREQAYDHMGLTLNHFQNQLLSQIEIMQKTLADEARNRTLYSHLYSIHELQTQNLGDTTHILARNIQLQMVEDLRRTLLAKSFDLAGLYLNGHLVALTDRQQVRLTNQTLNHSKSPLLTPVSDASKIRFAPHLWKKAPSDFDYLMLKRLKHKTGVHLTMDHGALFIEGSIPLIIDVDDPDGYETFPQQVGEIRFLKQILHTQLLDSFRTTGYITDLYNHQGVLVATSHLHAPADPSRQQILNMGQDPTVLHEIYRQKIPYFARIVPFSYQGKLHAYLIAYTSQEAVRHNAARILTLQLGALVLGLLLAGIFALTISTRITRPLRNLSQQMRQIATTRDLTGRLPKSDKEDEIGHLAQSFNQMIEALQESDAATRRAEQKYRGIVNHAAEGVFQSTLEGYYITANPALVKLFGYANVEELLKAPIEEHYEDPAQRKILVQTLRAHGKILDFEIVLKRLDGHRFTALINARLMSLEGHDEQIIEGMLQDISARREKEKAEQAKEAAEAATQAKTQFLATMSHEIRTPLNVIIGMSELLLESEKNPQRQHYLEISHSAGEGLLSLINDILDLSKIEAGKLSLEQAPFDPVKLLRQVGQIFLHPIQEKGVTLKIEAQQPLPAWVMGDAARIRQTLINLIGNAVKFTHQGVVTIRLIAPKQDQLCFEVIDSGIGIDAEQLKTIFKPFSQADTSITRRFGGSGLGLTICNYLIEHMGGELQVESQLQQGSRFFFNLPLPACKAPKQVEPPVQSDTQSSLKPGLSLLIADDSEDNITLLKAYLKHTAHLATYVRDGVEAESTFINGQFDLVLMDVQMPKQDGYSATRHIRTWEHDNNHPATPIYALSAHAFSEAHDDSLAAGCDGHLTKPIKRQELLQFLDTFVG